MYDFTPAVLAFLRALRRVSTMEGVVAMRKVLMVMLAAGGMAAFGASSSLALPGGAGAVAEAGLQTSMVEPVVTYHVTRTSRRYWVRGNLGRRACHMRYSSRFYAGGCG